MSVALFIEHVMLMRRIILSSVRCLVRSYFPHYPINDRIFEIKAIEHEICVLIFSTDFV